MKTTHTGVKNQNKISFLSLNNIYMTERNMHRSKQEDNIDG